MVRNSVVNDNDDYIRIDVQIKKNNSYPWLLNGMASHKFPESMWSEYYVRIVYASADKISHLIFLFNILN